MVRGDLGDAAARCRQPGESSAARRNSDGRSRRRLDDCHCDCERDDLRLVPALHLSERGLLHTAQVTATGRPAARRFRNGLVVGEIALALTVAVMAGLLAKAWRVFNR